MPMFIPLAVAVAAELGTVAIIGGALSAVGGLVGSKELSIIGGLTSLAGGAMSAFGGGVVEAGTELVGGTNTASNAAINESVNAPGMTQSGAQALADGTQATTGAAGTLAGEDVVADSLKMGQDSFAQKGLVGESPGLLSPTQSNYLTADPSNGQTIDLLNPGAEKLFQASNPTNPIGTDGKPLIPGQDFSATQKLMGPQEPTGIYQFGQQTPTKGLLESATDWAKNNPALTKVGGDLLKGGAEGYFKSLTNDQLMKRYDAANATAADKQALARELEDRKRANLAYVPKSVGMTFNNNANLYPAGQNPASLRYNTGLLRSA